MTTQTEIDLAPFCLKGESIKFGGSIQQPWTVDEWTYATDLRILIRVAARQLPPLEGWAPPKAEKMPLDAEGDWQPLPEVSTLERGRDCLNCEGSGAVKPTIECPCCESEVEYPGDKVPCRCCGGTGEGSRLINGVHFATKYLNLLHDLPGPVEFYIGINGMVHGNMKDQPNTLWFRCPGARGMLMAMEKPK